MGQNINHKMLPFKFSGRVVLGERVGGKIGFPTANLDRVPEENNLDTGVYIGTCSIYQEDRVKNRDLKCLAYFGPRYIFGQTKNIFEVYIYNFDESIYDLTLEVKLVKLMREPKKITTITELKKQLHEDKEEGLKLLQA